VGTQRSTITRVLAGLGALALRAAGAQAQDAALGAPNPQQGERLDGRAPPVPPGGAGTVVARGALWPLRAASWLVLRPAEAATGYVERKNLYGRAYEALTSDDRLIGLRPVVIFDPGYALSGGLRYFDHRTLGPGSLLEASGEASVTLFRGRLALEPPGGTGLRLALLFERRTDAIFGGTDGESRDDLESVGLDVVRYKRRAFQAMASWQRLIVPGLAFQLSGGYDHRDYGNGTSRRNDPPIEDVYCLAGAAPPCAVDPLLVPGFDEGLRALRAGGALYLDTRANARYSTGVFGSIEASYGHGVSGDPSEFVTGTAMVGGAVRFGDRSLLLRGRAGEVDAVGDAPAVPFEELLVASGQDGVRGLPYGRLRGRSELVFSAEYRWLLLPWLDAMLFVDRGNGYGPSFDGLSLGDAFTSVGIGLVAVDMHEVAYWRSRPRFVVQVAVAADSGARFTFAFHGF
jgi:hypothetical protein